jgi:hypothetical protein
MMHIVGVLAIRLVVPTNEKSGWNIGAEEQDFHSSRQYAWGNTPCRGWHGEGLNIF